jgi:hypothetical protein
MSDNNGRQNDLAHNFPDEPKEALLPCVGCGNMMTIQPTEWSTLNSLTHSVIIATHTDAIVCGACGWIYAIGINADLTQPVFMLLTVKKAESKIIVPGRVQ